MDLFAYSTSPIFFPDRLSWVLRLIICVCVCVCVFFFFFVYNNPIFLVKVRLLWVCLVLENLKDRKRKIN